MVDFSCFPEISEIPRNCRFSRKLDQIRTFRVLSKFTRENIDFLVFFQLCETCVCNSKFTRENIDFVHTCPTPPNSGCTGGPPRTPRGKIPENFVKY